MENSYFLKGIVTHHNASTLNLLWIDVGFLSRSIVSDEYYFVCLIAYIPTLAL